MLLLLLVFDVGIEIFVLDFTQVASIWQPLCHHHCMTICKTLIANLAVMRPQLLNGKYIHTYIHMVHLCVSCDSFLLKIKENWKVVSAILPKDHFMLSWAHLKSSQAPSVWWGVKLCCVCLIFYIYTCVCACAYMGHKLCATCWNKTLHKMLIKLVCSLI